MYLTHEGPIGQKNKNKNKSKMVARDILQV